MIDKKSGTILSIHKMYSQDALELDGVLFEPKKKCDTIVIHIHGKEGHFLQNHFVTTLGHAYTNIGVSFITFNNRGHDYVADMIRKTHGGFEFVTRGSAYDILSESSKDINGVIVYLKDLGYKKIYLQGHSLGPHKICYYLTHAPEHKIAGAILLSTSDIKYLFNAYVPKWKENRIIAEHMIMEGKSDDIMDFKLWSNALVSAKTYLDWTKDDADSWIFNFSDPNPNFKYFSQLELPIIVVNPENDVAVNTKQQHIGEQLARATKSRDFTFKVIPNAPHNFSQKEGELSTTLTDWVSKQF